MRGYLIIFFVFGFLISKAQKVSDLPAASSLSGTEVFPVVQSGSTKKASLSLVWSSMPSISWSSITGKPTTLSGYGITDPVVLTSGTYSNPSWITSLAWSKITGTPTTLSGYGITDALSKIGGDLTGTAGAGYHGFIVQSSTPATPSSGFRLYSDASNRFSWKGQNGFVRTFDGTSNTADRSYTLPNASGTVALLSDITASNAGAWSLSSGGTLTGANNIIGSATNTLRFNFNGIGITNTDGVGLWLQNSDAATAVLNQNPGSIVFDGNGWATTPVVSQNVKGRILMSPTSGTSNPIGTFSFAFNVNGAGYTNAMTLQNNGTLQGISSLIAGGVTVNATTFSNSVTNYATVGSYTGYTTTGTVSTGSAGIRTIVDYSTNKTLTTSGGATVDYVAFFSRSPVAAAGINSYIGFLHDPPLTGSIAAAHNAIRSNIGTVFICNSSLDTQTASTRLDVRGLSGGTNIARFATSANTERFAFKDAGGLSVGGSEGTSGQVLTSGGAGAPATWTSVSASGLTIAADATDASFTIGVNSVKYLPPATLTTNKTITFPTATNGDYIEIYNNEAGFVWLLAGAPVFLADNVTVVTQLLANANYIIRRVSGKWRIVN